MKSRNEDSGIHRAATVGLIENDGGGSSSSSQPSVPFTPSRGAGAATRATSRPPAHFVAKIQPFVNGTAVLSKLAWAKTILILLTGIPILRLFMFILASCALFAYILILNTLCPCCLRRQEWVNFWYSPIRWACRFGLFLVGFFWIEEIYPEEEKVSCWDRWSFLCCSPRYLRNKNVQPTVFVANHQTFMDALFIGSRVLPTAVGKADIVKMPILGPVIARLNPILVPRTAEDKQRLPPVMEQLIKKARAGINGNTEPRGQPIIVFPEGTTVNQRHLITFQKGAFVPGVPVRPIAIEYPFCMLDVANSPDVWNATIWGRQLCSLYTRMKVRYLPVYVPSEEEAKDPKLFAEGVRLQLAFSLGRTLAPHTDRDALLVEAAKIRFTDLAPYTVACVLPSLLTRDIEAALRLPLRLSALAAMIDVFFLCDSTGDGYLRREDLSAWAVNFLLPVMEGKGVNLLAKDLRAKGKGARGKRSSVIAPASSSSSTSALCTTSTAVAVAETPTTAPGLGSLALSGGRIEPFPAYVDVLFAALEAARSANAIDSAASSSSSFSFSAPSSSAPPGIALIHPAAAPHHLLQDGPTMAANYHGSALPSPSPTVASSSGNTVSSERKEGRTSRSGSFLQGSLGATLQRKASLFLQEAASGHLGGTPTDEHIMATAAAVAAAAAAAQAAQPGDSSAGRSASFVAPPPLSVGVGSASADGDSASGSSSSSSFTAVAVATFEGGALSSSSRQLPSHAGHQPSSSAFPASSPRGTATGWGAFRVPNARGLLSVRDIVSALALIRYGDGHVANSNFAMPAETSSSSAAAAPPPQAPPGGPALSAGGASRRNVSFATTGSAAEPASSTSSGPGSSSIVVQNQLRIAATSASSKSTTSLLSPETAAADAEAALGIHGNTGLTPVTETESEADSVRANAGLSPGAGTGTVITSPVTTPGGGGGGAATTPSPAVPPLALQKPPAPPPRPSSTTAGGGGGSSSNTGGTITRAQLIVAVGVLAVKEAGLVDMAFVHRQLSSSSSSSSSSATAAPDFDFSGAEKTGQLSLSELENRRVAATNGADPTVRAVVHAAAELVWNAWGLGNANASSSSGGGSGGKKRK